MGWTVAEQALRLAHVVLGMAHITGAEIPVTGFEIPQVGEAGLQGGTDGSQQVIKGGAVAHGHVVDLVGGRLVFHRCGQQVGLDGIADVAEVAAGLAVAVDPYRLVSDHGRGPLGHHGGIGTVGVLAGAEDVEVPETDGAEIIGPCEHVGLLLVHQLGDGVGRGWSAREVSEALLIDEGTLRGYVKRYRNGGAERLLKNEYRGGLIYLSDPQKRELHSHLCAHTYLCTRDIIRYIEKSFGVRYSVSGMTDLLHDMC